jgi:O-antigen/teichoic acid export membrane protein
VSQTAACGRGRIRAECATGGHLLAKNTTLGFAVQVIPLLLAVLTIPYVIHSLGLERFGILSLASVVLSSFGLFDMGLGRATTRFVAGAIGAHEYCRIPTIIWTSTLIQFGIASLGAILLATATPLLTSRVLKISPQRISEARGSFFVLSAALPLVMCSRNFRGVLEASQRFDLIALVQIPTSALNAALPAVGVWMGLRVPGILSLVAMSWVASGLAYFILDRRLYPDLSARPSIDREIAGPLLSFGGWVALCNLTVPALVSVDRLLISSLISVRDLAFYSVPYEAISRLLIVPGVLGNTLFPAYSALAAGDLHGLSQLYLRSFKYVISGLAPMVFVAIFFAHDILLAWLGKDFAGRSATVMQILAVGMLLNALAQMPAHLLDGAGRPDLRAKTFLSYLLPYLAVATILIMRAGIVGAALAWALRAGFEFLIFFAQSWRLLHFSVRRLGEAGIVKAVCMGAALTIPAAFVEARAGFRIPVKLALGSACLIAFAVVMWAAVFDARDRMGVSGLIFQRNARDQEPEADA